MRRTTLVAIAMALTVMMIAASPIAAITNGELDGDGHP